MGWTWVGYLACHDPLNPLYRKGFKQLWIVNKPSHKIYIYTHVLKKCKYMCLPTYTHIYTHIEIEKYTCVYNMHTWEACNEETPCVINGNKVKQDIMNIFL